MVDEGPPSLPADDTVRRLLLARIDEAYRLAMFILGDRLAAEDAVQQSALLAWDRRRSLRDSETAQGWFTRILVNICRDELRRRARRPRLVELDPAAGAGSTAPTGDADLPSALARLTADEQALLALRYGHALTVPEIARRLRLPDGTVKSRLHSTLEHLRAALEAERRSEEANQ
jgi:RNA polymerase sigma factor (sigma-70 family)